MPSTHGFDDSAGYITVREASLEWGISERFVQRFCADGRIEGARKFGRAWAIPSDASKPVDPRKAADEDAYGREDAVPVDLERTKEGKAARDVAAQGVQEKSGFALIPMPLTSMPFAPGTCVQRVEGMADERQRDIARAEYCYFCGKPQEAVDAVKAYLQHPDLSLRLSACLIFSYASLSLGAIDDARRCLTQIKGAASSLDENAPLQLRATIGIIEAAAAVLLHLPIRQTDRPIGEVLRFLPPGLRLFGLYVWAHAAYLQQDYARSFGIVEAAFAFAKGSLSHPDDLPASGSRHGSYESSKARRGAQALA